MDLTLTARPTYTPWLLFWARRRAPLRLLLLPLVAGVAAGNLLGVVSRGRVKEVAQRLLMGPAVPRRVVAEMADAFAMQLVIRPGALAQLAADRAAGLEPVMATASFAFYAGAIATRLGIVTVIATGSVEQGDRLLPRLAGANCYGAAKAAMVAARLPAATIARAYSDHASDAPLFALAAEAVAVNPSRGLRRLARRRGWRIVDWR